MIQRMKFCTQPTLAKIQKFSHHTENLHEPLETSQKPIFHKQQPAPSVPETKFLCNSIRITYYSDSNLSYESPSRDPDRRSYFYNTTTNDPLLRRPEHTKGSRTTKYDHTQWPKEPKIYHTSEVQRNTSVTSRILQETFFRGTKTFFFRMRNWWETSR